MAKPERQFSANEGDYSIGLAGPDAIEADIDTLSRMFDPLTTHSDGTDGGIGEENIQDDSISDRVIGSRTISDSTTDAYTNTGTISKLLSLIAKAIKAIKGTTNWYDAPKDTINNLDSRTTSNANAIAAHKTSSDHDSRYYTETEIDAKVATLATKTENALKANISDVYTKAQLDPWVSVMGGDTKIKEEVFTIITSNNGDGTFTYSANGVNVTGALGVNGEQIFTLNDGFYVLESDSIVAFIDDTLRRSVKSGGLLEITDTKIALSQPEGAGREITFIYHERIGLTGEHNIIIGENKPLPTNSKTVWFKVIG